jgi:hypothetical protein
VNDVCVEGLGTIADARQTKLIKPHHFTGDDDIGGGKRAY